MKRHRALALLALGLLIVSSAFPSCSKKNQPTNSKKTPTTFSAQAAVLVSDQVPKWTPDDAEFFLHGSMSSEFVPEAVLRSFIIVYPDLFPSADFRHLGAIPDENFGWPIGFTRNQPDHFARLTSIGLNCAACHVSDIQSSDGGQVRVLGMASPFDVEAFYGSILQAAGRTAADPANMKRFLVEFLDQNEPETDLTLRAARERRFESAWREQLPKIREAMSANPGGGKGAGRGGLQSLNDIRINSGDLPATCVTIQQLFHNMRAALHIADETPEKLPPASGPGRNDAFGLVSYALLGVPQPYAPAKFGIVWNVENRTWVHWDGNTRSPLARNLLASLGLGAPMVGSEGILDISLLQRHTNLSEQIRPPQYPFAIDRAAAKRGSTLFAQNCATCHAGPEDDHRLTALEDIGTDPTRAQNFTPEQATRFNTFIASIQIPGYQRDAGASVRSTQKYWAADLAGVWARAPYLHNGSVRTMEELLTSPGSRPSTYQRGSRKYDPVHMGFIDAGTYRFDAATPGNSNAGHDYGTALTGKQKQDLIEYLKTL